MVQRTEVVRAAEQRARQIIEAAETDCRRLRHETEDFLDQRLGQLRDPARQAARPSPPAARSSSAGGRPPAQSGADDDEDPTKGFFDQDRLT